MALTKEQYKVFEDIVGPEFISDDPVILDGGHAGQGAILTCATFIMRPVAVILPGSTEEIQAIIRAANRFKLKLAPTSSNMGVLNLNGCAVTKNQMVVDLRRMNRILDIDEKNMCAIIEPYVMVGQLKGELAPLGLTSHGCSAGPTHSLLASCTAMFGPGFDSMFMGWSGRNCLGVEWVMPTGEVARLGSPGSVPGWFYPDSPGISAWGTLRGWSGTCGGLGIYTKCATRIFPWPGEGEEHGGVSPQYIVEKYPELLKGYYLAFPSRDNMTEAVYRISKANIGYLLNRAWPMSLYFVVADSNDEAAALIESGVFQERCKDGFIFALAAFSKREMEYQEEVLGNILEDLGGESIDDLLDITPAGRSRVHYHASWMTGGIGLCYKPTGTFLSALCYFETTDKCREGAELSIEAKKEMEERGLVFDDGDTAWGTITEGGTLTGLHTEAAWLCDPSDKESMAGGLALPFYKSKEWLDSGFPTAYGIKAGPLVDVYGPSSHHVDRYIKRIKGAFDPNMVGNPYWYAISTEE